MARLPFCLCGVRGGDLTQRIDGIMSGRRASELTRAHRTAVLLGTIAVVAAPVVVGALTMRPQAITDTPPRFDIASVKRNKSSAPGQTIGAQGDRFVGRNVTVRELIVTAYDVPGEQVSGGPGWIDSERYDVEARATSATTWPAQLLMLRSLLADRFNLRLQRDSREIAAYDLVVSPSGVKMKPAQACRDGENPCGGFRTGPGAAIGRHVTGAQVARLLAGRAGRRVTDATGLEGYFDIELRWNPGPVQPGPAQSGPVDAPPIDPSGASLSVAIEEQLGLRFRPSKETTDYLTIIAAERPSEN